LRRRKRRGGEDVAELAALADGSLPPDRRGAAEERLAVSPELAALYAEQRRAVALTASAAAEVSAPEDLRADIQARRQARPERALRRALGAAAAALARWARPPRPGE